MTNKTETLSRGKSVSPHAGAWLWIAIAVLYSIAPLDFIPDVITPYGWVDDILVVAIKHHQPCPVVPDAEKRSTCKDG